MDTKKALREWIDIVEGKKGQQLNESKLIEWNKGDAVSITGGDHKGHEGKVVEPDVRGPNVLVQLDTGNNEYVPSNYLKKFEGDKKELEEKWGKDVDIEEPGKYKGKTKAELCKMRDRLKEKENRTKAESEKLREINFAIRAKTGWGDVKC